MGDGEKQLHSPGGGRISRACVAAAELSATGSGAWGSGSARALAGSPTSWRKCRKAAVRVPCRRRADGQHSSSVAHDSERMREPARCQHERSGPRERRHSIDVDLELAFDHVERLFLVDVDVHRGVRGRCEQVLHEVVRAAGLGVARLRHDQGVEEPGRFALVAVSNDCFHGCSPSQVTALCSIFAQ